MLGWGGRDGLMAVASFDFATEDGRVSGSKSALRTRASFAERVGGGDAIAIVQVAQLRSKQTMR